MATKRVVFEIEVETNSNGDDSNIEAAKTVQDWLQNPNDNWQFYVQDVETSKIVSVDLDEDETCMELPANDYRPMIQN